MIPLIRNRAIFFFLLIVCSCKSTVEKETLPFFNSPDFTPEWILPGSAGYKTIHRIPAFSFTDQNGETVTEKSVENKIYVADFIFTSCAGICPRMTDNMKILQEHFKNDNGVLFLSHSVTPERDSVPVLKKYATVHGIRADRWHLLTGNVKDIYAIAKKEYFAGNVIGYYGQQNDFLHTENFLLVDKQRRLRGVYNGTLPLEMERLIADVKVLEKE